MRARNLREFVAVVFVFSATPLFAIHDAIVNLIDGKIEDLPAEYQPATFDPKSGALRVGRSEIVLSPFLGSLFPDDGGYELQMTASWYHDRADGPYYLGFHITPKGKDFSYKFRLDLETLRLLTVQVELRESKTFTRVLDVVEPETANKSAVPQKGASRDVKIPGMWLTLDGGRRKLWVNSFPYPAEYANQEFAPKLAHPLAP